ncbi:MAG TPA: AI-2E family transporter [Candidatus Angelobacter sp.]|nr:AI-2E family transporter [Candidatus Angelobacter sp.]
MANNHRSDILFFFGVLLALWVAYMVRDVLMLIYVGALFAVVLSPAIGAIQKLRINGWRAGRGFAIVFLILMLALAGTLFAVFALPPVYRDGRNFSADWPKHLDALTEGIRHLPFANKIDPAGLQKYAAEIAGGAGGLFLNFAGGIFGLFTAVILTAYFIIDGDRTFHWAVSMFPLDQQPRLETTLLRAKARMRNWLIGQMLLMLSLGLASLVVYWLLGLKYFYLLAMFAGIANILPIAGPISAVLLASVVAVLDSPQKLVGVIVFFAIYFQFESVFLSPRIMKKTLNLSPLTVIIALSMGGSLAGVVGALVSVPTAALVMVLVDEYLVKRTPAETAKAAAATD